MGDSAGLRSRFSLKKVFVHLILPLYTPVLGCVSVASTRQSPRTLSEHPCRQPSALVRLVSPELGELHGVDTRQSLLGIGDEPVRGEETEDKNERVPNSLRGQRDQVGYPQRQLRMLGPMNERK